MLDAETDEVLFDDFAGPTRSAVDPSIIPGGASGDRRPGSEPTNENRDFWTPRSPHLIEWRDISCLFSEATIPMVDKPELVYRSFSVKNFRCFADFKLDGLRRINLIAGENDTGKTSLLEAIFLHAGRGNPDLTISLNAFRGISQSDATSQSLWGWMFHEQDPDDEILLSSRNARGLRSLAIRLTERTIPLTQASNGQATGREVGRASTSSHKNAIELEYRQSGRIFKSSLTITPTGIIPERSRVPQVEIGMYFSPHFRSMDEDAQRFSEIAARRRERELVEILKIAEPRLAGVELLLSSGRPVLHADLGFANLVPFPFLGDGVGRLLSIALGIVNAPGGIVLIDEIENGLHYSVMQDVWRGIEKISRETNVQIFCTTHSWEAIRSAHQAFSKPRSYDFALHRFDRVNGEIESTTYDRESLQGAIDAELEVR